MCESCERGEYRVSDREEILQLTNALLHLMARNDIGRNLDNEPIAGFMQYLYRSDEALGIVSVVASLVGETLREENGKPEDFPLYVQRVPWIGRAPELAASEDNPRRAELVARVQRSIQWINCVWNDDPDTGHALFQTIEAEGPESRASDIAQTLTMIEGVYTSIKDPADDSLAPLFA